MSSRRAQEMRQEKESKAWSNEKLTQAILTHERRLKEIGQSNLDYLLSAMQQQSSTIQHLSRACRDFEEYLGSLGQVEGFKKWADKKYQLLVSQQADALKAAIEKGGGKIDAMVVEPLGAEKPEEEKPAEVSDKEAKELVKPPTEALLDEEEKKPEA